MWAQRGSCSRLQWVTPVFQELTEENLYILYISTSLLLQWIRHEATASRGVSSLTMPTRNLIPTVNHSGGINDVGPLDCLTLTAGLMNSELHQETYNMCVCFCELCFKGSCHTVQNPKHGSKWTTEEFCDRCSNAGMFSDKGMKRWHRKSSHENIILWSTNWTLCICPKASFQESKITFSVLTRILNKKSVIKTM